MHPVVVETPINPISSSCKGPYRSCGPIHHQRKRSFPCIFGKCHKNMSSNKELMPLPACIFCHEAALWGSSIWCILWNKGYIIYHYFNSPLPHWSLGHWWSDFRRKGDSLPPWNAGEPIPAHGCKWRMTLCQGTMKNRFNKITSAENTTSPERESGMCSSTPARKSFHISKNRNIIHLNHGSLQNLNKNKHFGLINSILYSFSLFGERNCIWHIREFQQCEQKF